MLDKIQQRALETWYHPDHELHGDLRPAAMGLTGEAGELLDLVKKHYYKPGFKVDLADILDELGDVLFYLSILAYYHGATLEQLSRLNYAKLRAREQSGKGYNRGVE